MSREFWRAEGGGLPCVGKALLLKYCRRLRERYRQFRQYLEYRLLEIISKVKVPVPIDFALDDNNKQVNAAINAIEAAVKLHKAASDLVLDAAQQTGLQTYVASITGNFLAHYATGSTHAFSAASLLGVMNAIDSYAECFMVEDPPGNKRFYKSLSKR